MNGRRRKYIVGAEQDTDTIRNMATPEQLRPGAEALSLLLDIDLEMAKWLVDVILVNYNIQHQRKP